MGNIVWHDHKIRKEDREKLLDQKACLFWFTGLSGSGKSTLASLFEERMFSSGRLCYILDGDNVRHGLNKDLSFSAEDREENIRRTGEVSKLMVDAGLIVLTSFISPYKKDRDKVRELLGERFIEVHVKCDLSECEKRDPKGLYKKARKGEIKDFTGVNAPYEEPENPEVVVDTSKMSKEECVKKLIDYYEEKFK
ncbi:MAG: adenylyl-sulfate kinase [Nanobdellota archaeon]